MRKISLLFGILLLLLPQLTRAEEIEWARKAREKGPSPATKAAYEKAVENLKNKEARERQKQLKDQEDYKKLEAEQTDVFAKIEEKYMANDFDAAKAILDSSPIRQNRELYLVISDEISAISDYSEKCRKFFTLASQRGEEANAIANYSLLVTAYNSLPDNLHVSEKYIGFINSAIDKAEKYVKKECGNDYGQIRVGMKLARIEKCVGEFYLHGQVNGKYGVVDYYTRGVPISTPRRVRWSPGANDRSGRSRLARRSIMD